MAKKGAVQQLQAEINSDEDFEKFMEREGLLVLDVYTEWCGPCVGMIGSLKKIKLELGGDNLHLAVCKSDTVSYMERFQNKSEPTWIFASHKKIVKCLFGTNVPELMQTIADELTLEKKCKAGEYERIYFEWTELTPVEQESENKRIAREEEINRIEHEAALKRRADYLIFVTNEIMDKLPDGSVTLVMPNYAKERDIQKKLTEPGDKCGMSFKDRKFITIQESDLEMILFDLTNPLHTEVYKKLFTEDILGVFWKPHESELRDVLDLTGNFVDMLCNPQPIINNETGQPDPELRIPPVFKPWRFDLSLDVSKNILRDLGYLGEEDEAENNLAVPLESDEEQVQLEKTTADVATGAPEGTPKAVSPRNDEKQLKTEEISEAAHLIGGIAEAILATNENKETADKTEVIIDTATDEQGGSPPLMSQSEPDEEEAAAGQPKPEHSSVDVNPCIKASVVTLEQEKPGIVTLTVPAIYAAQNKRGNAFLIYLYFRHLTEHFLPPDPVPEPPHVAVIFDAVKRKDVCQLMATLTEGEVLAYGYFSGIDPDTANLLAKTNDLYSERKFNVDDKMVLKVAKKTSDALLKFGGLGPTFVSFSSEEGKEECKKFFPCGYNEEDEDETSSIDSSSSKKKRKKKKKKDGSGSDIGISEAIAEEEGADEGDNLPDDDEGLDGGQPEDGVGEGAAEPPSTAEPLPAE